MNRYHLSLAIGIHTEIEHLRALGSLREGILLIAGHATNREALGISRSARAVAVNDVVDGALIALLEHRHVNDVGSDKLFIADLGDQHGSVASNHDHVVNVGAVAHKLILAQGRAHKPFHPVDVELGVGDGNLGGYYLLKTSKLCFALAPRPVLFLQVFEELYCVINQIIKMMPNLRYLPFKA